MLNLLIIRRRSLTWFLVILMLEGTLFLILKHWREGLWLSGLWCFPFLRFLSYLFWCFASWGMLNSFIIIQPQHHLGDGQICQSESLENPMKRPYIRWQLVLIQGEERWGLMAMVWISQQDSSTFEWYASYPCNSRIDVITDEWWRTWMGWSLGYDIKGLRTCSDWHAKITNQIPLDGLIIGLWS